MASQWFIWRNDTKIGPISSEQLKELAEAGRLLPTDYVQKEGRDKLHRARAVRGLFPDCTTPPLPELPTPGDAVTRDEASRPETPSTTNRSVDLATQPAVGGDAEVVAKKCDRGAGTVPWLRVGVGAGASAVLVVAIIVIARNATRLETSPADVLHADGPAPVAGRVRPATTVRNAGPAKPELAAAGSTGPHSKTPNVRTSRAADSTPSDSRAPNTRIPTAADSTGPRVLENGPFSGLITKPSDMRWEWITFSPDGKTLAAAGEGPEPRKGDVTTVWGARYTMGATVGRTRQTFGFWQVWNLVTNRSLHVVPIFQNNCQRAALRFTPNGQTLYANARENQGVEYDRQHTNPRARAARAQILQALGNRGREYDRQHPIRQPEAHAKGGVILWTKDREKPFFNNVPAGEDGFFAAAHLSADSRRLLLVHLSEGVQEYEVKRTLKMPRGITRVAPPNTKPTEDTEIVPRGPASRLAEAIGQPAFFSSNGTVLLARLTRGPGGVVIWDAETKQVRSRLAPPGDGVVGHVAASSDAGRVAVAAAGGRTIRLFDGASGQPIAKIGPLDQPVTGLAMTAGGESLWYASGRRLYRRDLPDGPDFTLPGADDLVGGIAVSPDGRMAAAGASDGAIHLWTRRGPDAQVVVKPPMDAAEALVALGPRDVRVTTAQGKTETLALVRLTPERALVARGTAGKRTEAAATDNPFVKIETIDGKQTWQLDPTKKHYVGPKLVPTASQPVAPSLQATPDQEDLYLLLGARRLFAAIVEMVDQPDKEEAVADARRQVLARLEYLKSAGRAPAVAELYSDLARAVDELRRAVADRRVVVAQMKENARQAGLRRVEEHQKAIENRVLGFTALVMGSLQEQRPTGRQVRDSNGFWRPELEYYDAFPGLAEAGVSQLLNEAMASKLRQAQLRAAEGIADVKTGPALVAALKARNDAVDRIDDHYDTVAARDFGLAKAVTPSADDKALGIEATLAWLTEESRRVRGRSGRDDPFTLASAVLVRSLGPPGNTADALFREAREIVALIPLVPPTAVFDPDRAALCGLAAELVTRAVDAETGAYPVTESYSEKAAFAVSLLDHALALRPDDPTGKFRQARAVALAQADRLPDGLAQARDLIAHEPKSAGAHYTLARLECAAAHVDRGLDHLEEAVVKLGFRNLNDARARAEFPRNHPRFESLTRIQVKVTGNSGGPLAVTPIHNVVFQNTGPFALHDVVFRVRYQVAEPGKRRRQEVSESSIDTLLPGQSHAVKTESNPVTVLLEPGKGIGQVGRRMAWVNAEAVVTAPGQGTLKLPIEGQ